MSLVNSLCLSGSHEQYILTKVILAYENGWLEEHLGREDWLTSEVCEMI